MLFTMSSDIAKFSSIIIILKEIFTNAEKNATIHMNMWSYEHIRR